MIAEALLAFLAPLVFLVFLVPLVFLVSLAAEATAAEVFHVR